MRTEDEEGEAMAGDGAAAGAAAEEQQRMSAAAFVEGGVQEAAEDTCSICLENFGDDEPATVTTCKHEYHLQCILEWAQRSKECPMCWQPLCLQDPDSQAILAAAEQERELRVQRSALAFHHHHHHARHPGAPPSALDDSLFHRFAAAYENSGDLEDRIMNHLAAAAMGRAHQFARFRPSQAPSAPPRSAYGAGGREGGGELASSESPERGRGGGAESLLRSTEPRQQNQASAAVAAAGAAEESQQQGTSSSELSFPDTLKSRLFTVSSRYRETLTKTTRGLRERFRARGGALAELAGNRAREVKGTGSEGSSCTQDRQQQQQQQQQPSPQSVAPLAV